jgi:hypothetical protein
MSRYEIQIENCEYSERRFTKDASSVNGEWAMMRLVEEWIRDNHEDLRLELDPDSNIPQTETYPFEVTITDTDDGAEANKTVYAQPDEPVDAEGDWEYQGCYNSVEYYVCASLEEDGADWWKLVDHTRLAETDGYPLITYTQETPERFVEADADETDEEDED